MVADVKNPLYEVVGAVHLHSDFSDGSLPIPEIAEIADRKGLDFLMFSDHNTLEPKRKGMEKWYGKVLVLIGYEINDPQDCNHYLAFRIQKEVDKGLPAKEYVRRVRETGGFGIIAHPAEKRNFSEAYPPYPWTAWDAEGFDGIEIWNQLSEWIEGVTRRNVLWRILHPLRSIRYPVRETLGRWDRLNQTRRVVGVGGIDVHAYRIKLLGLFPLEIYPYKVQFRSIRTHLLTKNPLQKAGRSLPFKKAEEAIFGALSMGRCFVSNFRGGDAKGFRFWVERRAEEHPMGSRLVREGECVFRVRLPLSGTIRILQDGQEVKRARGKAVSYRTDEAGVFRTEVFRKNRGWIYSNPIVITDRIFL